MKEILLLTATTLKELGEANSPITFDELVKGIIGADDEIQLDEADKESLVDIENNVILFLDSIGIPEKTLNDFLSNNDVISSEIGLSIAKSISTQYDDVDIIKQVENFEIDNIQFDNVLPDRKIGYTRKLVVRNGKKVWINKRNPNKKVHLTPKQKLALMKARLKAHTSLANKKRQLSVQKRATFNLK